MIETTSEFKNQMKFNKQKVKKSKIPALLFNFLVKTLIMVILFLTSLIYIRQSDINKVNFNKIVYKNTISFAKIYSIYQRYLGDVIPFKNIYKDNTKVVSSEKISYDKISKKNNGYILSVSSDYSVPLIKSGIVISITTDKNLGKLVKVQDKNGLNITYGCLSEVNVKLYDYLDKGELIGKSNKTLYLEFMKDDKYLSYEKYL